jgi:gluconate 2-dehydrogenase gamma chain
MNGAYRLSTGENGMSESVKTIASDEVTPEHDRAVSRRSFLKGSGAAAVAAGAASLATATHIAAQDATPAATPSMGGMTMTPLAPGDSPVAFFTLEEAQLVDAIASRILPGDENDPGAHEAGVVNYIDGQLAGTNLGYTLKTYSQGPFLNISEEPVTVEAASSTDIYRVVLVASEDVPRFGYQSVMTPQQVYRRGLGFVNAYAQSKFQDDFINLTSDQQDSIITDMADDSATGFDGPGARAFFTQLRNDTIEGMFSDPMYSGNRDMVGWKLIGYPGAQRLYTPDNLKDENFNVQPQSLQQMMAMEEH